MEVKVQRGSWKRKTRGGAARRRVHERAARLATTGEEPRRSPIQGRSRSGSVSRSPSASESARSHVLETERPSALKDEPRAQATGNTQRVSWRKPLIVDEVDAKVRGTAGSSFFHKQKQWMNAQDKGKKGKSKGKGKSSSKGQPKGKGKSKGKGKGKRSWSSSGEAGDNNLRLSR